MLLDLTISVLTQGLLYALLAYGIFITYKILDFPDLTVDGSFPLGAAVTAVLLNRGVNCYATIPIAMAAGALAGLITGLIHVRFKIRDLLAGIITMTALFSVNLQIAGSNLAVPREIDTVFTSPLTEKLTGGAPLAVKKLVVALIIAVIVKIVIDLYFRTKSGLLLRATGSNGTFVTTLAKDKGSMKILGLVIADTLVALSGCLVCQEQRAFAATMGTGQMVFGLAAVIIGTTLFKKLSFVKGTTCALVGSVIYKACIQLAINLGLPTNLLKLVTAVLFLVILVVGNVRKGAHENA